MNGRHRNRRAPRRLGLIAILSLASALCAGETSAPGDGAASAPPKAADAAGDVVGTNDPLLESLREPTPFPDEWDNMEEMPPLAPIGAGDILVLLGLCGLLAGLVAGLYLLRRRLEPQESGCRIDILARRMIDHRNGVVWLRAGNRQFLVGVGPQGPRLLADLPPTPAAEDVAAFEQAYEGGIDTTKTPPAPANEDGPKAAPAPPPRSADDA